MNTSPLSCMAMWFPLEDVTEENAPLLVVPGSHKGIHFFIHIFLKIFQKKKSWYLLKIQKKR